MKKGNGYLVKRKVAWIAVAYLMCWTTYAIYIPFDPAFLDVTSNDIGRIIFGIFVIINIPFLIISALSVYILPVPVAAILTYLLVNRKIGVCMYVLLLLNCIILTLCLSTSVSILYQ